MTPPAGRRDGGADPRLRRRAAARLAVVAVVVALLTGCTAAGIHNVAATSTPSAGRSASTGRFGATGGDSLSSINVVPASDKARQANLMSTLCNDPIANITCAFAPTSVPVPVLGKLRLLSPIEACAAGGKKVSTSQTTEESDTLGVSVSVELGKVVKQAVEASYSVTWSSSNTTKVEDEMELPDHTEGFAYRAAPLLRATGDLTIREAGATVPGANGPQWYVYELTGVTFDAPDTSPTAHGVLEFASRPMTAKERSGCVSRTRSTKGGTK